ncbi:MAG: antitoxin [Clostridia bacterium]|nr:antitoxin [Clostridia bacterium]
MIMSNAKLKLMVSVFRRRMSNGETFEQVARNYPKLTAVDIADIEEALRAE